jgi:thiamine-phosphate pyrophosphorylase
MSRLASSPHEDFQRRIVSGDATLRLYAVLDAETCARRGLSLLAVADAWRDAGIRLVQYRDKRGSDIDVLTNALALQKIFNLTGTTLILNDRVHLFGETGFQGLHIGQTDAGVQEARRLMGTEAILGISTHNPAQLQQADSLRVSYVAVGPVYPTATKTDADPVVGPEGVRTARTLTTKPLVAIGGITRANAAGVLAAGADCIAVISALLPHGEETPHEAARSFLHSLAQ